jgi:serine protease
LVNQLVDKGVFVVAAAGNNFHKPLPEPANCKGVLSVGSVDAENRIEVYSALDPRTVLYAPGGGRDLRNGQAWEQNKLRVATYDLDVLGRERPNALDRGVGTSFAAPVVSGFLSLWLSHHPNKTPSQFMRELPQFLQSVTPMPKCPDCQPKGLLSSDIAFKP